MADSQKPTPQTILTNTGASAGSDFSLFYVPCPDEVIAQRISTTLLKERLIACTNILPGMQSHYWWENKIEVAKEVLLIIKTESRLKQQVQSWIEKLHPYTTPCMIEIPVASINHDYLIWMKNEISGGSQ